MHNKKSVIVKKLGTRNYILLESVFTPTSLNFACIKQWPCMSLSDQILQQEFVLQLVTAKCAQQIHESTAAVYN
jgi:hypothetical protein